MAAKRLVLQTGIDINERSFYKFSMGKGEHTRQAILDEAFALASCVGVGGLSIGMLAERTKMSKSGLFAHFGSKEELQLAVLREAQQRFAEVVLLPAFRQPRGLGRLRAIVVNWLDWTREANLPGGCVINAAAAEFDDQPGPLRDEVRKGMLALRHTLATTVAKAVAAGELRPDTDPDQLAFELEGIYQVAQQSRRLLNDPDADRRALLAFDRLVRDFAVDPAKE
jgi:AcrR family transcriptional regulator